MDIQQWDDVLQLEPEEHMAAYRLAAYRHLVLWLNGRLGQGIRNSACPTQVVLFEKLDPVTPIQTAVILDLSLLD